MGRWQNQLAEARALLLSVASSEARLLLLEPEARRIAAGLAAFLAEDDTEDKQGLEARRLLGWLLWYRYLASGYNDTQDLDNALRMLMPVFLDAMDPMSVAPDELQPLLLAYVIPTAADALQRAVTSSDLRAADVAVRLWRTIVAAAPPDYHIDRAGFLSDLGTGLQTRFERGAALADLHEAIEMYRASLDATPIGHPNRGTRLSNLGNALRFRFTRTGMMSDLDEAIAAGRAAVEATPAGHFYHLTVLSNLGVALYTRFEHTRTTADLNEAITAGRTAAQATPAGDFSRAGRLSNLGIALQSRFERLGDPTDLDEAIQAHLASVAAAPPDHPDLARFLSNLGATVQRRFELTETPSDMDQATRLLRLAVDAAPPGHPEYTGFLTNLSNVLRERFEHTGTLPDLDEAIAVGRAAVEGTASDHPERAAFLTNLGAAFKTKYEYSCSKSDARAAVALFAQAVALPLTPPSVRVKAARTAASLGHAADAHTIAQLLETAIGLLPQLTARHLDRGDQQHSLYELTGLASDAAALALQDARLPAPARAKRALRLLEAGRAVLLSQSLDTRNDLTDLHQAHPELARRYRELCDLLDASAPSLGSSDAPGLDRRALTGQFDALLDQIRSLPGFASFARLPEIRELATHTAAGPIVTFNVSAHRSDALLLTPRGVTAVALPRLDPHTLRGHIQAFHQALATASARDLLPTPEHPHPETTLRQILAWLWDAAAKPVLDALGYRHPPAPGQQFPRVWWAPGGLLGLLPLHAAGHHDASHPGQTVIDRVVSSYTPTVRALHHARQQAAAIDAGPGRSLIVAMPTTPDLPASPLPFAAYEAALLSNRLPAPVVLSEPVPDLASTTVPTRDTVLKHLPHCAIAHFACHATHDPADPSRSHLLLHDHATAPLTVAGLAPCAYNARTWPICRLVAPPSTAPPCSTRRSTSPPHSNLLDSRT